MKFFILISLFICSLNSMANINPRVYPVRCDGSELISNVNTILYDFSFNSECLKALSESRVSYGHFCDGDRLIRPNGDFFHEFNWSSGCQKALNNLRASRHGLFCDDKEMYQIHIGYLTSHSFESYCLEALNEALSFNGFFCRDGQMFDYLGNFYRDYSFRSSCKKALQELTFER